MNKEILRGSAKEHMRVLFISFCLLSGTAVSLYLSIAISAYFYLLAVPSALFAFFITRLSFIDFKNSYEYKRKYDEKYFSNGEHTINYGDKSKKKLNIINGKRNGEYTEYYPNGQLKITANYNNGDLNGAFSEYYPNGQLKITTDYSNGELDGLFIEFFENGMLRFETKYSNGFKQPEDSTSYYRNGNIFRKCIKVISSNYEGFDYEYYEYSATKKLKFKNKRDEYTFFDINGNISCEIEIIGGWYQRDAIFKGIWKSYRACGTIKYELDFDNAVKDGKVLKTIYTIGGEIYLNEEVGYSFIKGSYVNFLVGDTVSRENGNDYFGSYFLTKRQEEKVIWVKPTTFGPPGADNGWPVFTKSIISIEDIIKFT